MKKEDAETLLQSWHLGQTSARYESSGGGAATIAHVPGDHGGASYGEYQLSSRAGTLREYLSQSSYGARFTGLSPGSPAFDEAWRHLAHADGGFGVDQHQFIGRTHYGDQMHRLAARGLDLTHRGAAVQDCIWSTSVQMRNLTPRVFEGGVKEAFGPHVDVRTLSDRQIVEAVQDYKIRHNAQIFSQSPTLWNGLLKRASAERQDLVKLADADVLAPHARSDRPTQTHGAEVHPSPTNHRHEPHKHTPHVHDQALLRAQTALTHLGYTGADGRVLHLDGIAGPNSRHAISQFQRDQGMQPTGSLDSASAAGLGLADRSMASSTHPAHALYDQSLKGVWVAEQQRRVASGPYSIALAGVIATEAVRSGLARVDRVELGSSGQFARGIQFSPTGDDPWFNHSTATIDTRLAFQHPLATSSEDAAQLHARQAAVSEQQHRQTAPMRAPVL